MDLADPQQWNPYTYANNSPVTLSDPSGLIWINDGAGKYVPPPSQGAPSIKKTASKPKNCKWYDVGCGAKKAGNWVSNHKAEVAGFVAGTVVGVGCGAAIGWTGVGAIACGAAAGAVGSAVTGYMKGQRGLNLAKSTAVGGLFGAAGGALFSVGGAALGGAFRAAAGSRLSAAANAARGELSNIARGRVGGLFGGGRRPTGASVDGATGVSATSGSGLGRLAGREIRVSDRGLARVSEHLSQFGEVDINRAMLGRLSAANANGMRISGGDASFYMHELAESQFMRSGMDYMEAHSASFAKYDVSPFSVYPPEVVSQFATQLSPGYRRFWGLG